MARNTDIGERLWTYMKSNPTSAVALAKKIGISHSTLLKIVHDACEPRTPVRIRIENFLQNKEAL